MKSSIQPLLALSLCLVSWGARGGDAAEWFELLHRSNPEKQAEWAARYEHGEGVARDYTRAVNLYCAAASRGYAPAQYRLGWLYANGRGLRRDDAQAKAWFHEAAAQGHVQAKNMVSVVTAGGEIKKPNCSLPRRLAPSIGAEGYVSVPKISPEERRRIEKMVRRLAPQFGLDPKLVLAVIEVESAFQPQAISPKNAQGLMQLIPETADRFGVQDIMDPTQNLRGGMAYLRWLLAFFQGDVLLALAGYNAGENTVVKYQGIPPYPETQAYVARIVQRYGSERHPPVAQVVSPSTMMAEFGYNTRGIGSQSDRGGHQIVVTIRPPKKRVY